MNIEECYERLGGSYADVSARLPGAGLVERFMEKFLQDKSYGDLSASMKNADRKGPFLAAHTLKGVSANLGFTALWKSSSALCEELRGEGEGVSDTAYALFSDVERDYTVTVQTIRAYLNK